MTTELFKVFGTVPEESEGAENLIFSKGRSLSFGIENLEGSFEDAEEVEKERTLDDLRNQLLRCINFKGPLGRLNGAEPIVDEGPKAPPPTRNQSHVNSFSSNAPALGQHSEANDSDDVDTGDAGVAGNAKGKGIVSDVQQAKVPNLPMDTVHTSTTTSLDRDHIALEDDFETGTGSGGDESESDKEDSQPGLDSSCNSPNRKGCVARLRLLDHDLCEKIEILGRSFTATEASCRSLLEYFGLEAPSTGARLGKLTADLLESLNEFIHQLRTAWEELERHEQRRTTQPDRSSMASPRSGNHASAAVIGCSTRSSSRNSRTGSRAGSRATTPRALQAGSSSRFPSLGSTALQGS